jgi:hypothetical protein
MAVRIGNNTFFVGFTDADNERRESYFLSGDGELTKDEQGILDVLGIDGVMENILRLDLPEFFQKLPECDSDTSLVLKKDCEIPYYVIWTTLLKNRHETKRRLETHQQIKKPMSDLSAAVTDKFISNIAPVVLDETIDRLFTLILPPTAPLPPVRESVINDNPTIDSLFRIIPQPAS